MNQMMEYSAEPVTVALADLRMWASDPSAITPIRALECVRIIGVELGHRRMWWLPVFGTGMLFGAFTTVMALIIGGSHP